MNNEQNDYQATSSYQIKETRLKMKVTSPLKKLNVELSNEESSKSNITFDEKMANLKDSKMKSNFSLKSQVIEEYKDLINNAFILYKEKDSSWKMIFDQIMYDESILEWDNLNKVFIIKSKIGNYLLKMYKFWILADASTYIDYPKVVTLEGLLEVTLNSRHYDIDNNYNYDHELILLIKKRYDDVHILEMLSKIPSFNFSNFPLKTNEKPLLKDEDYQMLLDYYTYKKVTRKSITYENKIFDENTVFDELMNEIPFNKEKLSRETNDPYSRFKKLMTPKNYDNIPFNLVIAGDEQSEHSKESNLDSLKYRNVDIKKLFSVGSNLNFPKETKLYLSTLPNHIINTLSSYIDELRISKEDQPLNVSTQENIDITEEKESLISKLKDENSKALNEFPILNIDQFSLLRESKKLNKNDNTELVSKRLSRSPLKVKFDEDDGKNKKIDEMIKDLNQKSKPKRNKSLGKKKKTEKTEKDEVRNKSAVKESTRKKSVDNSKIDKKSIDTNNEENVTKQTKKRKNKK